MLSLFQSIILGTLQGIAELFPISSLGHTVILPSVFGWTIDQTDPLFISFIVATHFATALVLLGFFYKDWFRIIRGMLHSLYKRDLGEEGTYARLGWLLVLATIPAGLLGLLFQERLQHLFASPRSAAAFLVLNGIMLFAAEFLLPKRRPSEEKPDAEARLSWRQSLGVGFMQCLALLPGFSRTGATLSGGLMVGLSHEHAARFSFLLATPIIFAAAALKLPKLLHVSMHDLNIILVGALCAGLAAYLSIRFLSRYFKHNTLLPFAIYCVLAGMLVLFFIA
jgi:undecaprenyl-diphosphatase